MLYVNPVNCFMYTEEHFNNTVELELDIDENWQTATSLSKKNNIFSARLPDNSSVFTAEAEALQFALEYVKNSTDKKHIIYSDSLSCLQAIKNCKTDHPYIY